MSFAFKEELNELAIFRRCCSAANLWVLTLSRLSIIDGADILHKPRGSNIGWLEPLGAHEVGATVINCELFDTQLRELIKLIVTCRISIRTYCCTGSTAMS